MERDRKRQKKDQSTKRKQGTSEMSEAVTPMEARNSPGCDDDGAGPALSPDDYDARIESMLKERADMLAEKATLVTEKEELNSAKDSLTLTDYLKFSNQKDTAIASKDNAIASKDDQITELMKLQQEAQAAKRQKMDDGGAGDVSGYIWWLSSRIRNKKMHAYNGNPISLAKLSTKIKSDFPSTDESSESNDPDDVALLNTFIANVNQRGKYFSFIEISDLDVEEFYTSVRDEFKEKVILKCARELIEAQGAKRQRMGDGGAGDASGAKRSRKGEGWQGWILSSWLSFWSGNKYTATQQAQGAKRQRMGDGGAGDASVKLTEPITITKQEIPLPARALIYREDSISAIAAYIYGVYHDEQWVRASDRDKGYKVFSTYGIPGLGKTSLFRYIYHYPEKLKLFHKSEALDQNPAEAKPIAVGTLMLTFNTQDLRIPEELLPRDSTEANKWCLGAILMWAVQGWPQATLNQLKNARLDPEKVLEGILKLMKVEILVIFVDELGKLPEASDNPTVRAQFLSSCINAMSRNVVFIFSAIVLEELQGWAGPSGVGVSERTLLLPLLPSDKALDAVKSEVGESTSALLNNRNVFRLLDQCFGHPRAVFDFFVPALRQLESLGSANHMSTSEVSNTLALLSGNLALPGNLKQHLVVKLISPVSAIDDEDRLKFTRMGMMVDGIVLPVILRNWAYSETLKSNGQQEIPKYLNMAFKFDSDAGHGSEKAAESDFLFWDSARRVSLKDNQKCALKLLYNGAGISDDLIEWEITVRPDQKPSILVVNVDKFSADTNSKILGLLNEGKIVVSNNLSESAVEYLAPIFREGILHILGVQVKFERKGKKTFKKMDSEIKTKLKGLFPSRNETSFISLIFTTHEQIHRDLPDQSICFNIDGLSEYMKPLGPLRVLTEKRSETAVSAVGS